MAKTSTGHSETIEFLPLDILDHNGVSISNQDWINSRVGVRVTRSIDIDRSIYLNMICKLTGFKIKSANDLRNVEDTE